MGLKTPLISSGLADKVGTEMEKWIQKRNFSLSGSFNFYLLFDIFFPSWNYKAKMITFHKVVIIQ